MSGATPLQVDEDDLNALVDGRLDPARGAEIEAWLGQHPDAAAKVAADREVRARLRERLASIAAEPIPERLRVAGLAMRSYPAKPAARARNLWWPVAAAAVLCLTIGGAAGWAGRASLQKDTILALSEPATQEAVQAFRTFVPEVVHPVEVKADQRPHLIQWLTNRLGKPVDVPDLTTQGFTLMGGRVVPTDGKPASLLMYDDDQKARLTLFSRVGGEGGRTSFRFAREGDVSAFSWVENGVTYVVTARIDQSRLLSVAEAIDAQLRGEPAKQKP